MTRYHDWLRQAENDLQWARYSFDGGYYAQTCFISQQVGEKALKAYCFFKEFDVIRSHSLFQIIRALHENGELEKHARELDIYYISGRYPDAFPGGAPFEMITKEQAERSLAAAKAIFAEVSKRMERDDNTIEPADS
ncbi:MAG: HEPN domain-containing protein [Pseudomonadota bacterium]